MLLPKYLLLVVSSGTASYLGIQFLTTRLGVTAMPAKLFVETLLFFVNFAVQRMFIFHGSERHAEGNAEGNAESNGEGKAGRRERAPTGRFYTWLILAVLAVLVALEIYGFRTSHLFSQEIWDPQGRARLLQFGALYLAAATALLILAPWIFAGLAAALLVVLTAIAIGPAALLAVVFFLISAWSLGGLVTCLVPAKLVGRTPWSARVPLDPLWADGGVVPRGDPRTGGPPHLLSLLLGMSIYIFLMPFAARLPVNYAWVYALVLALPILADLPRVRREFPACLRLPAAVPTALLGRAAGLRGVPLCADHPLVRHAQARGQRGRPFHAPGDSGEHRGPSRDDLRPRTYSVGGHAHGRGFHLLDGLPAGRRDGRAPAELRDSAGAARPAPRGGAPLGFRPAWRGCWWPSSPPRRWCNWSPARCSWRIC